MINTIKVLHVTLCLCMILFLIKKIKGSKSIHLPWNGFKHEFPCIFIYIWLVNTNLNVCINVIRHLITKVTLIPITLSAISSIYTIQAARYTNQHQLSEYLKVCSINIRISRTSKQSQHASSKFTTFLLENRSIFVCRPLEHTLIIWGHHHYC